jgi:hypothetical protein
MTGELITHKGLTEIRLTVGQVFQFCFAALKAANK